MRPFYGSNYGAKGQSIGKLCYCACSKFIAKEIENTRDFSMERQQSSLVSEEKKRIKNEKARAKRASESENEKRQRCDKRYAADRARRALKQQQTSTKRQVTEQNVTHFHQKRQRLTTESEKSRLELLRSQHAVRLEAETPVDSDHLSTLCQIRMSMESEKERESRLQQKLVNTNLILSMETEEERTSRLQHVSDLQQQHIASETHEERASRLQCMSVLQKHLTRELLEYL